MTTVSPLRGRPGTKVRIHGRFLGGALWVRFGATKAVYTVPAATTIVVTVPRGATSGRVTVATRAGTNLSQVHFTVVT